MTNERIDKALDWERKFRYSPKLQPIKLDQLELELNPQTKEANQVAKIVKKGKKILKKKGKFGQGRKADPQLAKEKKGGIPVVIHLPGKLRARAKLACIALNTNLSTVLREQLETWVTSKKKEIARVVNMEDTSSDEEENEEEEEEEDTDTEEEGDEEEDEDEEEEESDDDDEEEEEDEDEEE